MDLANQYNSKSPAVKRLMREAREMQDPTEDYSAAPVNDNLFEWHFTIKGASDSDFEGGLYHGRIIFPSEYPMKPPNILLLTPNGRFETNKKICLTISGHHPETWQPSWCVRTALLALIAFMPTPGSGTVGSLDYTKEERQMLARNSLDEKNETTVKINSCTKELKIELGTQSECVTDSYSQEVIDKLLLDTNKLLSKSDADANNTNSKDGNENFENIDLPDVELIRLDRFNIFSNVLSNISNSKVTVSIIIVLIAFLLYRRIFLLN
ncbi:hypothetical protein PGB90_001964 [Kerria lacca]